MQDKSSATAYASDEGTEEIVIPLRPHHGMCLAYFKGEGYSNDLGDVHQELVQLGAHLLIHAQTGVEVFVIAEHLQLVHTNGKF